MNAIEGVDWYLTRIAQLTPDFVDDGLSGGFPDWMYERWNLHLAGRVHDWHYCTRCHRAGTMDQTHRKYADLCLRVHSQQLLPWWMNVAPWVLYFGVRWFGDERAFDSCGADVGERCRHNMLQPTWMRALG